ncbi:MAG: hypothetical protein QF685_04960 [Verrucomicrobiota bacterium]|jgi:hypothetical protein|nr:hypothetical protein [Verrucomicrobiota bacterium]
MLGDDPQEEKLYALAAAELERGDRDEGLWAKCFVECDGEETKAKVRYIKVRVSRLKDEKDVSQQGSGELPPPVVDEIAPPAKTYLSPTARGAVVDSTSTDEVEYVAKSKVAPSLSSKPKQHPSSKLFFIASLVLAVGYTIFFLLVSAERAFPFLVRPYGTIGAIVSFFESALFMALLVCLTVAFKGKLSSPKFYLFIGACGISLALALFFAVSNLLGWSLFYNLQGFWQVFRLLNVAIWIFYKIVPAIIIFEFVRLRAGKMRNFLTVSIGLYLFLKIAGYAANIFHFCLREMMYGMEVYGNPWMPDSWLWKVAQLAVWLANAAPFLMSSWARVITQLLFVAASIALLIPIFSTIIVSLKRSDEVKTS